MNDGVEMKAYEVLEQYGWCQGNIARDELGVKCEIQDPGARSFCAHGAIWKSICSKGSCPTSEMIGESLARIFPVLPPQFDMLHLFNDHPETTKEMVIELLKKADV